MKKDIYIIRNNINDKVYIGQAKIAKIRWAGHKSAAKCHGGFIIIDKAMASLGIENFTYEIIESQIENYNEREQYWIAYYNSQIPNGYNYLPGGEGAPAGVDSPSAAIRDQKIIDEIITCLLSSDESINEIANRYGVNKRIISAINRGTAYLQDGIEYPIRNRAADMIELLDIEQIKNDLQYSEISINKLAANNNTTTYIIRQINLGKKFRDDNLSYPLRNCKSFPKVQKVKEMLKTTNLSLHEIGRQCDVSYTMVAHINIGKYHFDENEKYPIR